MGYKTTTDIFELRGMTDATITGASGGVTAEIDTSLDTLNREVLLVWEVDIRHGQAPFDCLQEMAGDVNGAKLSIANNVQSETGVFGLDDSEFIAGQDQEFLWVYSPSTTSGNMVVIENRNPESTQMPSRDKSPLAILTSQSIVLRTGWNTDGITLSASDTYQAQFRIYAQRARADADTYAALVTGLL